MRLLLGTLVFATLATCALSASAQSTPSAPTGAPPADAKALVAAPKDPGDAPKIEAPLDGTTVALSAGGLLTSGNSRLLALSANGTMESRFASNGIGAALIANYGEGAPPGRAVQTSAQNIQGRIRYDRYFADQASFFLIVTGRHDRFQGLDIRMNWDPGVKYLFLTQQSNSLWGEAGYDLQYDVRRNDARAVLDDNKNPVLGANGQPSLLDKTFVDHSTRLYVGYRRAFNKEVTLTTGLEYLQSMVDGDRSRLNFDAIVAAKIGGGFALGMGFSARFDNKPLPSKKSLDTSTTLSLIYAFSDVPDPDKEKCPCPDPTNAPPPEKATPAPETPPPPAPVAPPPAPEAPPPAVTPAPVPTPTPPMTPPPPPSLAPAPAPAAPGAAPAPLPKP